MSESTVTNLDGVPQYPTAMLHPTNAENHSKSMTIIVQNPFEDPSNSGSISRSIPSHPVRFNQELLTNFNINVPTGRQTEFPSSSNPSSTTSLIPLPSPLPNNLGVPIHQMNQASITPAIIGSYPSRHTFDPHHQPTSTGMYSNHPRPTLATVAPQNGTAPIHLRYANAIQASQYRQQIMKPRMVSSNTYATMASQPSSMIYDPNSLFRASGQPPHPIPPDDNILKSLLQVNAQMTAATDIKPRPTPTNLEQVMHTLPKPRKKRKGTDPNTSCEDGIPTKPRKRKKKGTEETEKFVEYSLQRLRDLLPLIPVEPLIDISNEQPVPVHFSGGNKPQYQGDFGDVFIDNINDHYRPHRRAPPKSRANTLSSLERRYRLCSSLLDRPPCLPSPPLLLTSSERLSELVKENGDVRGDESIVSTSTVAEGEDLVGDIQMENMRLLKTLSTSYDDADLRSSSPIMPSHVHQSLAITDLLPTDNEVEKSDQALTDGTEKVSVTLTLTTEAANNVQSVIAAVADLLKIAYPATFDVHQTLNDTHNCTCSPATNTNPFSTVSPSVPPLSRALSVYKVGREASVNIQSLIDTQPKICRYCSHTLTADSLLKKRPNEIPVHLRELTVSSEPCVYFCNEQCFNAYASSTQQPPITSHQIKQEPKEIPTLKCVLVKREAEEPISESKETKRWKRWDPSLLPQVVTQPSNLADIEQLMADIKVPLAFNATEDGRVCVFCRAVGDLPANGPGRLLNLDVGQWCHLNCAFWSSEVYETLSGSLMCVEQALARSVHTECVTCQQTGASLTCFYPRCATTYHFQCAVDNGCVFSKDKTMMCPTHASKAVINDQILEDKSVLRKVWIERDEIKQIQNYMNDDYDDQSYILRIGSLILHNIGQLLPHQIQSSAFHNRSFIYPVGYTVSRFHWSMHYPNRRCVYTCSIIEIDNKPMFRISVHEDDQTEEFLDCSAKAVWHQILPHIDSLRRQHKLMKMFPVFVNGEDLFGLTEPHVVRLIESLPGVEMLPNYAFKYGRLQLFDMPLTVNPTGCARSEPKLQTHFRRHAPALSSSHSTRSALPRTVLGGESSQISYGKQFTLSKSTQYRKLKVEWRQNTYLAKSRIQGLGLFAARDLEKHTMIIEYIGELIRNEVANKREKLYEEHNHGIYMFRLDDDYVVDATMSGCLARYINHCCDPNAFTEVVQIEKENKIIIIANRRIAKGEEIKYDYKFDFEEDSKLPCLCGAVNCRKWMN